MKVHLVFTLNETGSLENGIIHLVSSVRYRLYIWLIIKLRKSLRLLDNLSLTNYLLPTIIKCNNIFDTNILSRGYPTKLKICANPRGWGPPTVHNENYRGVWGYDKHPPTVYNGNSGRVGESKVNMPFMEGMDIFWNYTIIDMLLARLLVANFNLSGNFFFPSCFNFISKQKQKERKTKIN